jgi:uncharacterized protein (DUF952 family)
MDVLFHQPVRVRAIGPASIRQSVAIHIYKILGAVQWREARARGVFDGAGIDLADGYIHFSTAAQVRETAARHFAGRDDLMLLTVDLARLPATALRWEPSRGGELFPHLYAALDLDCVLRADPLPLLAGGGHGFPETLPEARDRAEDPDQPA